MVAPRLPKRTALLALAMAMGAAGGAGGLAACGLAQGGLGAAIDADAAGGGDGATGADAGHDATTGGDATSGDANGDGSSSSHDSGMQGCATLDAACIGTVPSGWQPVGVSDGGCASGFTAKPMLVNPRLEDGGCACGACQVVGAFLCNTGVDITGGDQCMDPTLVTVTPGTCTQASAQHVQAHVPNATGSVGCTAPNDAGSGVTTDSLNLCVPGCTADYCAGPRCLVSPGDQACPSGFQLFAKAGTGAFPGCAPCSCEAGPPGACSGTVTVWDSNDCTNDAASATYSAGPCNTYNNNYGSLRVDLSPPTGTCTAPTADEGDASLTGVVTICCQ